MKQKFTRLYLIVVFIILYAPIVFLIAYSFSQGDTMTNYHGFTWRHYQTLFSDSRMLAIVANTLLVALLSSLIATLIGTLGALGINRTTKRVTRESLLTSTTYSWSLPMLLLGLVS